VPIIVGVFIASATELEFDTLGLCSSLLSTAIFAFLNVLAKKVFDETGMHPVSLLALNSQLASVLLFPFWVWPGAIGWSKHIRQAVTDGQRMWWSASPSPANSSSPALARVPLPDAHFLLLLSLSGLCSFFQNLCAFLLIHQASTIQWMA
jgi:hypothetical protein